MKRIKLSSAIVADIEELSIGDQNKIKLEAINQMISEYSEKTTNSLREESLSLIKFIKETGMSLNELVNVKIPAKIQPITTYILDKINERTEKYSNNPIQSIKLLSKVFKAKDFDDLFVVADTNISDFAEAFGTTREKANTHLFIAKTSIGIILYELKMTIWTKIIGFFRKIYVLIVESSFLRLGGWLFVAWLIGVIFGKEHIKNFLMKSMMLVIHVPLAIISDIAVGLKALLEIFSDYKPLDEMGPFISRIGSR